MSRYLQEGKTGFFDIDAESLLKHPHGELFKMMKEDEVLRSSILSGINYFANSWDVQYRYFNTWCYSESVKFDQMNYETVIKYAIPALRELNLIQHRTDFQGNKQVEIKGSMDDELIKSIPEKYREITLDKIEAEEEKNLVKEIISGSSFAVYGDKKIDKTAIGWAAAKNIKDNSNKSIKFIKQIVLNTDISSNARSEGGSVGYIDSNYSKGLDVLIIDDVGSLSGTDVTTRNFIYLVKQRYENRLQTILLLNINSDGVKSEDVIEKFLGQCYSMFNDEGWPASVITLSGGKK